MPLSEFTIEQLGLFITLVLGSGSLCVLTCFKSLVLSRCEKIKCGCMECDRDVLHNEDLYQPKPNNTQPEVNP